MIYTCIFFSFCSITTKRLLHVCVPVTGKACSLNFSDNKSCLDFDKRGWGHAYDSFSTTPWIRAKRVILLFSDDTSKIFFCLSTKINPLCRKTNVSRDHSGRPSAIILTVFATTFFQQSNNRRTLLPDNFFPFRLQSTDNSYYAT